MRDHFIDRLSQMAQSDPRIMLITGDLGFGVLDDYRQRRRASGAGDGDA